MSQNAYLEYMALSSNPSTTEPPITTSVASQAASNLVAFYSIDWVLYWAVQYYTNQHYTDRNWTISLSQILPRMSAMWEDPFQTFN